MPDDPTTDPDRDDQTADADTPDDLPRLEELVYANPDRDPDRRQQAQSTETGENQPSSRSTGETTQTTDTQQNRQDAPITTRGERPMPVTDPREAGTLALHDVADPTARSAQMNLTDALNRVAAAQTALDDGGLNPDSEMQSRLNEVADILQSLRHRIDNTTAD